MSRPKAGQLFAAYAEAKELPALAAAIGEQELSPLDDQYLEFAEAFAAGNWTRPES